DHWLVRRRPGYDRPKHRGDGVTKEHPQAHLFKREGAEWKPVAKATNEVNRELTDLLGLTHEQFARVIVLPQGQFQRVLRPTNAREREELLTSLFDTELFGSIESWVQDRWRSAAADVADGQRTLEHLRSQAHDRHRELSFDDARATDVDLSHAETPHDDVGAELAVDPSASQITDQDGFDRVAESARRRAAGATDLVATTRAQLDRALATHASVAAATERWDRRAQLLAASQQLSSTAETAAGWAARLDAARAAAPLRTSLDAAVHAAASLADAQVAQDAAATAVRSAVRRCPLTVDLPVERSVDRNLDTTPSHPSERTSTGPHPDGIEPAPIAGTATTELQGTHADTAMQPGGALVTALRSHPDRTLAGLGGQADRLGRLSDLSEQRAALHRRVAWLQTSASASSDTARGHDSSVERLTSDAAALSLRIDADRSLAANLERAAERVDRYRATVAAIAEMEQLVGRLAVVEARREQRRVEHLDARDAHQNLRERYLDGIAAALSAELTDGVPCTVCGSVDHPHPASDDVTDVVARKDVDALSAAQDRAELALQHATAATAELQRQVAQLRGVAGEHSSAAAAAALSIATDELAAAEGGAGRLAEQGTRLESLHSQISQLRDDANQARLTAGEQLAEASTLKAQACAVTSEILQAFGTGTGTGTGVQDGAEDDPTCIDHDAVPAARRLTATDADVAAANDPAAEATADRLLSDLDDTRRAFGSVIEASRAFVSAERERSSARRSVDAAASQLADQLDRTDFATVTAARAALLDDRQISDLDHRLTEHREQLVGVAAQLGAEELAGLPADRPLIEDADLRLKTARVAEQDAVAAEERTRLAADAITRWSDEHRKLTLTTEPARREAALLHRLSDTLNGRSGSKVSLQRWVLAAFLDDVCTLANQRLATMTGGRYTLLVHRGDTPGNRAAGLDLRVLDAHTGAERDVSTLSGGETFQASLALALAVADAVEQHAGGIRMEALFIDEGFGTLDPDALELAMDELDALRAGGRMVGIISHVGTMQERIRTGIRVQPSEQGSTVHVGRIA
ncbi:MAG TPA: SbcC/MukB-like Walker B domain-containing protein, partial [Microthrixaceae bacterium]|nr:SbcC/MukB-like Walker B domain-containing protein [Microthrixaceae bacterium]